VARQKLAAGQGEFDLGMDAGAPGGPLPITASRMDCLLGALERAYGALGLDRAAGGDEVFRDLVLARIIEPVRSSTACGCWRKPGSRRCPTGP
jgi:hypothetical protein